ncbi:LysM peptidoglycan-binding domain-containing protein [uncultured Enterococcus sp.]|uniref:LysM peptidoglycan-binding domain-containing protein n=1 Tax=uncultured Enterococcus sp. TaxID=167972 RepID=UPI0025CD1720|nr:LysM peptidoglycan-binding domain-containing protein [uncultured Enterococcus sp.]
MKKQLIATMAATTLGGITVALENQTVRADETTDANQTATTQTLTHTVQAGDTLSDLAQTYSTTVASLVEQNSIQNQNLIIVGQKLVVGTTTQQTIETSTPTETAKTKISYTVQAGDTVSAIADRFNVSVNEIGQWNKLANVHLIFIGQTLTIEQNAETPTPVETPVAETPAPVETPAVETPAVETPAVETPAVETPVAETPAVETPVAETPVAETPAVETPVAETPVAETPAPVETPAVETPAPVETPAVETPAPVETPKQENVAVNGIYTVQSGETIGTIADKNGVSVDDIVSWNNLSNVNMIFVGQKLTVVGTTTTTPKEETTVVVTPSTPSEDKPVVIDTNTNTNTPTNTVVSSDATLNALNDLRVSKGLNPVVWDADLAATATARAYTMANNGYNIPNDHWRRADEVIAFYFAPGIPVINAWYYETNMITASGTGHRDWELNPNITRVGFGYSGNAIVGHSR